MNTACAIKNTDHESCIHVNFKDLNQLKKCYSVTNNGNSFTTTVSTIAITCLFITDIMKGNISLNLPSGWYINDNK